MLIPLLAHLGGTAPATLTDITTPSNLSVYRYGPKYVELMWIPSTRSPTVGVKWYRLYINGTWDGQNIPAVWAASTMNTEKLTLSPNTAYSFYVTAVDSANVETLPSNTVNVTTARNVDVGKFRRRRYSIA